MNSNLKKLIFDIGMFDGADTRYYLNKGYKVLAVEANTVLVKRAKEILFNEHINNGDLTILNFALTDGTKKNVSLTISATEPGASTILDDEYYNYGSITVQAISIQELFNKYGVPYYLKLDIEGADKDCILSLNKNNRPHYLSCEVYNHNIIPILKHVESIGYSQFKLINQTNFREINNQNSMYDYLCDKIIRRLGYKHPKYVKRNGDYFLIARSSGPFPWNSDGKWNSSTKLLSKWQEMFQNSALSGWYDLQAK